MDYCKGNCGTPLDNDAENYPKEKYKYCHEYCCVCCPDRHGECDKEKVDNT